MQRPSSGVQPIMIEVQATAFNPVYSPRTPEDTASEDAKLCFNGYGKDIAGGMVLSCLVSP
jgi:hypothetical protein